jgi:hypothetical protein
MFVLNVAVMLAGVLSETIAARQRVTLLAYVLPVCTPIALIGERLVGWAIALVVCVPAALFLLRRATTADLRRHAAHVRGALADQLDGVGSPSNVGGARSTNVSSSSRLRGMARGNPRPTLPVGTSSSVRGLMMQHRQRQRTYVPPIGSA